MIRTVGRYIHNSARAERFVWRMIQKEWFSPIRPKICHQSVFQLEGKTRRSKNDLRALVLAKDAIVHYFSELSYANKPELKNLGETSYSNIPSTIAEVKPDMVFLDTSSVFCRYLDQMGFFLLPYVNFVLDISDTQDSICGRMHRSKRRMVNRVKELGCSFETTNDDEQLDYFYHHMYRPRILRAHGRSAEVVSYGECKRLFKCGGLLNIKLSHRNVSGAIYVPRGDDLYVPMLGISQLESHFVKEAGYAALYALIQFAKRQGFKRIDYGSCKPFFKDGPFLYKKEWGMKIQPIKGDSTRILAIRFCNLEEGTRDFILSNPFVFEHNGKLQGLVFDSKENPDTCSVPGLSTLFALSPIYNPSGPQQMYPVRSILGSDAQAVASLRHLSSMAPQEGYKIISIPV